MSLSYLDRLFRGLAVLCGTRSKQFDEEKSLRQFQFKIWLRTDEWPADCFERFGKLFAAARISDAMRVDSVSLIRDGQHRSKASLDLIRSIRSYRKLVDVSFYSRDLTSIPSYEDYEMIVDQAENDRHIIRDLNAFTHWRMRIAATRGFEPVQATGWQAYQAYEDSAVGRTKRTVLRPKFVEREARIPFIFVSEYIFSELLDVESKLSDEVNRSGDEASVDKWCHYIEGVLHVMQQIGEGEHERLSLATGLKPKAWRYFDSLNDEELDRAGIKPDGRRAASQTKKAVRQKPQIPT